MVVLTRQCDTGVYALECEDNHWYVGASRRVQFRLCEHFQGNGVAWTQRYQPVDVHRIEVLEPDERDVWTALERRENELTLSLMRSYGWERVRGGKWLDPVLDEPPLPLQPNRPQKCDASQESNDSMRGLATIADNLL